MKKRFLIALCLLFLFVWSGACERSDPYMEREIVFFVEKKDPEKKKSSVGLKEKVGKKLRKIEQELMKYSSDDESVTGLGTKLERLKVLIGKGKYKEADSYADEMLKELL